MCVPGVGKTACPPFTLPLQKWDALGHGIRQLAPSAVAEGASISVLYNWEARAAADAKPKVDLAK